MNDTLHDVVRSMMAHANLSINLGGGDALLTAAYILNRVPRKSISATPYELQFGKKPSSNHLRPWGLPAMCITQPKNMENLVHEPPKWCLLDILHNLKDCIVNNLMVA